jgi:c(7)-type cytochrome triheme protein
MPDYDISLFSHQVHVGGMGFGCADCHSGIFEQAAGTAKAAGDFNMASFAEGKYCGACHDGSTAFSVKDEAGCKRCHGSDMKQPRTIVFEKPVKAVVFNHTMHTDEIGLACADCHDGLFKMKMGTSEAQTDFTMASIYKGKYCGACHDGATAFDSKTRCTKCHIGVLGYNRLIGNTEKKAGHEEEGH